jgi:hypothetical protein
VCTGYGPFDLKAIPRGGFVELALPPKIQKMFYGKSGAQNLKSSNSPALTALQSARSKPKPPSSSETFLNDEKRLILEALKSEADIEFVNGIPFLSDSSDRSVIDRKNENGDVSG